MDLMKQIEKEVESGQITEYNQTEAALAQLEEQYGSEVPDASTKEGYERAKKIAQTCTKMRTSLEARRKEFKAPVLALGKMVDGEAKLITERITKIEKPFKDAYRKVDEEKKRIKLEIEERFVYLKNLPNEAIEKSSGEIETMIEDLAQYDVSTDTFGKRVDEASALVASMLERLTNAHAKAIEDEQEKLKIEAERAELEQLRREREERERLQREAEEKAQREAEEARIAEAAAEQARKDEEARQREEKERLENERLEAERKAREAEEQAKKAKLEAEEARKQAELDRKNQEAEAKRQAEEAAERARQEEIEKQRQEQARKEEEERKLQENRKHVAKICKQSKEGLMSLGLDEDTAKKVVAAIAKNEIPNLTINY